MHEWCLTFRGLWSSGRVNKKANHPSLEIHTILKVYTKCYRSTAAPTLTTEGRKRSLNLGGQVGVPSVEEGGPHCSGNIK